MCCLHRIETDSMPVLCKELWVLFISIVWHGIQIGTDKAWYFMYYTFYMNIWKGKPCKFRWGQHEETVTKIHRKNTDFKKNELWNERESSRNNNRIEYMVKSYISFITLLDSNCTISPSRSGIERLNDWDKELYGNSNSSSNSTTTKQQRQPQIYTRRRKNDRSAKSRRGVFFFAVVSVSIARFFIMKCAYQT